MRSGSRGSQQLNDRLVQSRVHQERDSFIASIRENDVLHLASSYHNGDPCYFFKPPVRGSYNICYFIEFPLNGSDSLESEANGNGNCNGHSGRQNIPLPANRRWVIRVPLQPCLAHAARTKLESEVATMQ